MQLSDPEAGWPNASTASMSALLSAAAGVVHHGITICDLTQPDSPLIYVNVGFEDLTGYTAAEVLGRNCRFLQGEERQQEALPIIRKAITEGQACCVILRNYRKDGSPFWNELSLYPLRTDDGTCPYYVGIQHDITEIVGRSKRLIGAERKAAHEAALHAHSMTLLNEMSWQLNQAVSEADVYRIAAHYTPQLFQVDQISVADLDQSGAEVERVTLYGEAVVEHPRRAGELSVPADGTEAATGDMRSQMNAPLLTGGVIIGRLHVGSKEANAFTQRDEHLLIQIASLLASNIQSRRLFAQTEAALNENRRLYTAASEQNAALIQTLAQLHATQAQLLAAEKMASLGRLVAGLAHEISTPIGIAVTAASVWEDRTAELWQLYRSSQIKRRDFEEFLQAMTEGGKLLSNNLHRAAELIQSFKQVAVDQSSEAARTVNLKTYIYEIVASLRPEFKRTKLTVEVISDEDLIVQSYPGALAQIMTNLLLNSVIHAYEPDVAGHITITIKRHNEKVYLEYRDDGKGILPEHQDKIFEPFFTTRRGQGGSGLGLHIVYNLVTQKLGGTIGFQSEVGVGTTFMITLPFQV